MSPVSIKPVESHLLSETVRLGIVSENWSMAFAHALTKTARLVEIQRMFATRPNRGLRTAEIAERLGIAPRTVR